MIPVIPLTVGLHWNEEYEGLNRMRSGERSYMVDVDAEEAVEARELVIETTR